MSLQHAIEIKSGNRFSFGENWSRFLRELNDDRIRRAEESLCEMLKVNTLQGKKVLEIGSGSGLFSLAARKLGAKVCSIDYDPHSVACTSELRNRYFKGDGQWYVEQGSALNKDYLARLGKFDVVYSWGALHHTGRMHEAFENAVSLVRDEGKLFIAIYNDQGWVSKYWTVVKRLYNKNLLLKALMVAYHAPYLFGLRWLVRAATGRLNLERGMSLWYDMFDWLGGYPFEVAKPEVVFHYFRERGFVIEDLKTCGGRMGCNEFVFRRVG